MTFVLDSFDISLTVDTKVVLRGQFQNEWVLCRVMDELKDHYVLKVLYLVSDTYTTGISPPLGALCINVNFNGSMTLVSFLHRTPIAAGTYELVNETVHISEHLNFQESIDFIKSI